MNRAIAFISTLCVAVIAGYYLLYASTGGKSPEKAVVTYIEAMKSRDFPTLFSMNHRTQKRTNIIDRAPENEQAALLEKVYAESEAAFKAMQRTGKPDLTWGEKFFFVPEMRYELRQAETEKEAGTPSSDYRFNNMAVVTLDVSYPNLDISPDYKGRRLKQATLHIDLIQSKDVVKGMQAEPVNQGWLFQWLRVDEPSAVYWKD